MALHFSPKQEIKLRKSPLREVICQVKFPPVLRINQNPPVEFQEIIRSRFPQYTLEQGIMLRMPGVDKVDTTLIEATLKTYRFKKSDGSANAALSADFFAVATNAYTHWHSFLEDIEFIHHAVLQTYDPAYATRIGLRFVNRFDFNNTKTKSVDEFIGLFRGQLTCMIQTDSWDEPDDLAAQIVLNDDGGKLSIRTNYGFETKQPFFLLDLDYFEEGQISLDDLITRINRYHARLYDAFRWCVRDEILDRFDPLDERQM